MQNHEKNPEGVSFGGTVIVMLIFVVMIIWLLLEAIEVVKSVASYLFSLLH